MTSAEMLARLISLLDDTAAGSGFWTTTEYYAYLASGQRETAKFINKLNPNSSLLRVLLKDDDLSGGYTKALPSDFMAFNTATYAYDGTNFKPCREVEYEVHIWNIQNPYLSPSKNTPVVYIRGGAALGGNYYFYPTNTTTSNGVLTYLASPVDIASDVEPILNAQAHDAIVQYAFYLALVKNKDPRSVTAFQEFEKLASVL